MGIIHRFATYSRIESETGDPPVPVGPDVPVWDAARRELWFRGVLVKRLRVPAENQQLVLDVFQESGWAARIEDPLPGRAGMEPSARLRETIRKLNGGQSAPLVRFAADGTGEGVLWVACVPPPRTGHESHTDRT